MRMFVALHLLVALVTVSAVAQTTIPNEPDQSFFWNSFVTLTSVPGGIVAGGADGVVAMAYDPGTRTLTPQSYLLLPEEPSTVKRAGDRVIVHARSGRLFVVSLASWPHLELSATLDPPQPYADYAVADSSLYLARDFDGLWRFTIASDGSLSFVDSSLAGVRYSQVEVVGTDIFALDAFNGLLRYDRSAGGFGILRDTLLVPTIVESFVVVGDSVVIASDQNLLIGATGPDGGSIARTVSLVHPAAILLSYNNSVVVLSDQESLLSQVHFSSGTADAFVLDATLAPNRAALLTDLDSETSLIVSTSDGQIGTVSLADLAIEPQVRTVYGRGGPIRALALTDSSLITAGINAPLEIWRLDDSAQATATDTVLGGLRQINDVMLNGDSLLVLYSGIRALFGLRPDDSGGYAFFTAFSSDRDTSRALHAVSTGDTSQLVVLAGPQSFSTHAIFDSNGTEFRDRQNVVAGVTALGAVDSFLIIGTQKRELQVFRLLPDYEISFRGALSLGVIPTAFATLPTPPDSNGLSSNRLIGFGENELYGVNLSSPGSPEIDSVTLLPKAVRAIAVDGTSLVTAGDEGLMRFDISNGWPELTDIGGRGGSVVATRNNLIAVSDGRSVNLYNLGWTPPPRIIDPRELLPNLLAQNYPNPFNPQTTIDFRMPSDGDVSLVIYNILGQEVTRLVEGTRPAGLYSVTWDGRDRTGSLAASGVYLYRLTTSAGIETRKMMLVR